MEEITNIQEISPITFEVQSYSPKVTNLISSVNTETQFSPETDYIEYYVYDLNGNIVYANNFGFPNYTLLDNQLAFNPQQDIIDVGFDNGQYNTLYNFLSNELGSNGSTLYYISEISTDRTEVRLASTALTRLEIIASTTAFVEQQAIRTEAYPDFYLNFGNNQLIIANNILLDDSDFENPTVLIKLYEPLPFNFTVNTTLWVVKTIAESKAYAVSTTTVFDTLDQNIALKGPNTNLSIKDQINNSTEYGTHASLSQTTSSQGSGSLQYQINSLLANKGIKINIDYSDYTQFINFSSAQTRLENFYYKLSLIEEYNTSASLSNNTTTNYYVSSSNVVYQNKIDDLITNFDGYEYYLYYTSGSTSWPKTNSTFPYINAETTSTPGQNFLVSQSAIAESFDDENNNALINSVPSYLREDPANAPYELFVEMVGQNYDSVWVYLKDVTNKFDADNRLNYGISKDLIAQAIRDLGVNIYQNNFSTGDLYSALLGITPSGSLFNLPNTTGSLPTPTGYEYIDTYITASATGSLYPVDDINKSIYKRIYHNLPYLLKKKGTVAGLKSIISLYGIPDTILRVNEFGGKDIDDSDDYDFWQNQYDYKWDTQADGYIESEFILNTEWRSPDNTPATVEFRFQTPGLDSALTYTTQSLWQLDTDVELYLQYTGSGYTSGSYSGSIPNPENEYAKLVLSINGTTGSVYLPFFDGGWWSAAVTRENNNFTLLAGNNIYTGEEGSSIGFTGSMSFTEDPAEWNNGVLSNFAKISTFDKFSGSLQEIRYYNQPLSQSVFNDYVMNHNSIEGNSVYQSANQLAFRSSLGGELYTGSTSIHPKVTGSSITESFGGDSNFTISNGDFTSKEEYIYLDQFPAGIKNRVSDKIKQSSIVLPYTGSLSNTIPNTTLSPFIRAQQNSYASESYTHDLDYVEVAFSPQNEINDDIIGSIGYLNIGEYIGDPRQVSSSSETYPQWNTLRDEYFAKYKNEYNIFDYVRLIKYLDNSLFKMLQDFVPARTALAAGVVIKQHLLERNKYPVPQLNTLTTTSYQQLNDPFVFQNLEVTGSPIQMYTITGSNGGSMPELNGEISGSGPGFNISPITQSWTGSTPSLLGAVPFTEQTQEEFFDGELSGSEFVVTDGELNTECDPFKEVNTDVLIYNVEAFAYNSDVELNPDPENYPFNIFVDQTTLNTTLNALLPSITSNPADQTQGTYTNIPLISNTGNGSGALATITVSVVGVISTIQITNFGDNEYDIGDQLQINAGVLGGSVVSITLLSSAFFSNPSLGEDGDITLWWNAIYAGFDADINQNVWNFGIEAVKIFKISDNGVDNTNYLGQLENIRINTGTWTIFPGTGGTVTTSTTNIDCNVESVAEYADFFLYFVSRSGNIKLTDTGGNPDGINIQGQLNVNTALSPYVLPSFNVSDCNPILNNVPLNRVSNRYYDVDYSSNAVTAVNEEAILSGSAPKANVQNSNYTLLRQISPRYLGTKNTSATTNAIQEDGLASIDHTTAFFLYSPGGNYNTIADRSGSGLYKIGFMVDELGNTYEPQESESAYLPNLLSGFGKDSKVTFVPTVTGSDVAGTFPVHFPATKIKPILYTDTGSLGNDFLVSGTLSGGAISMYQSNEAYIAYASSASLTSNQNLAANTQSDILYTQIYQDQAQGWGYNDAGDWSYTVQQSSGTTVFITADVNYNLVGAGSGDVSLELYKNGDLVLPSSQTTAISAGNNYTLQLLKNVRFEEGDNWYFILKNDTPMAMTINSADIVDATKVVIRPVFVNGLPFSISYANSFTNGPTSRSVLTASQAIATYYGGDYIQGDNITGYQFNVPFDFKPYDEIRWNGTEEFVSLITEITSSITASTSGVDSEYNLYIKLAEPLNPQVIDFDYYEFRRNVFQKNTIIVNGPGAVMEAGFILPEYQSPLLKENLSSIIQNLTANGLISTT